MVLNRLLDPLWLNADAALGCGGAAVLKKALCQCNVVAIVLVDLSSVPLSEAVRADAIIAQVVTDDAQLLLDCTLCNGKNGGVTVDTMSQTVILNILQDNKRNSEDPVLVLVLHDQTMGLCTVPVP